MKVKVQQQINHCLVPVGVSTVATTKLLTATGTSASEVALVYVAPEVALQVGSLAFLTCFEQRTQVLDLHLGDKGSSANSCPACSSGGFGPGARSS